MTSRVVGANVVGVVAAIALYLVLTHWLMSHAGDQPWAVAALLGPLWCFGLLGAIRKRSPLAIGLLALAALAVGVIVARGGAGDVQRLYLLEHVGIHLALCFSFGFTLRRGAGRMSLIERVATRVHGRITPDMAAYARRVTVAWTVYFMAMAAASVLVYYFAGWSAWAMLASVGTPLALVAMFVGEHVLRYRLHPEFERAGMMDTVRAYRNGHAPASLAAPADSAAS